jgi:3'-5' exoribonuclease
VPGPIKNRPIASWKAGDTVQGFAFLRRKELRQDKGGRSYLDLELVDATGAIPGKAWSDSAALAADFAAPGYVKFRGQAQSYRDQLQLKVENCRAVVESDRADGFDEAQLVPTTKFDLSELWARLEEILAGQLHRPEASRLAEETLAAYGERLRVHPAAKGIHHAYRGGLLEHVVSMLGLAVKLADHYPELDRDLLLLGVLFHDLGKLIELGAMPVNDYTPAGRLVGHVVIGRDLLRERIAAIPGFPADLALELEHLVLSHQGKKEFASPVEPMTPEAFALNMIDDLDSKLAVLRGLAETGSGFVWAKSLERFVWLGESTAATASGEPDDEPGLPADEPVDQKTIW